MTSPMIRLSELGPGGRGRLAQVGGPRGFRRRLMEMGLLPGTEVCLLRCGGLSGLVHLEARESRLSVRESEARELWVLPN